MYLKIALFILLLAAGTVIEIAGIDYLPGGGEHLNLVLVIAVFLALVKVGSAGLFYALAAGWLLDAFSFAPLPSNTIALALAYGLSVWLLDRFFTNRSLYTFIAVMAFATFFHFGLMALLSAANDFIGPAPLGLRWQDMRAWPLIWQTLYNVLSITALFYLTNFLSNRYKPFFLGRGTN